MYYSKVKQHEIPVLMCKTCKSYKPPRSFHCSQCKACIEVHDHHCPWVGNCVGKRNHKYFVLFGAFTALHAILVLSIDVVYVFTKMKRLSLEVDPQGEQLIGLIMFVFSACIVISLVPLTCYHCHLVRKNRTTNEAIREKYRKWGKDIFD